MLLLIDVRIYEFRRNIRDHAFLATVMKLESFSVVAIYQENRPIFAQTCHVKHCTNLDSVYIVIDSLVPIAVLSTR